MITFSLAFLGTEDDLPHVANVIMGPLELSSMQALALCEEAIDVDRLVELSVRDDVFGRLVAVIDATIQDGLFDADEIAITADEPLEDPAVHRIHIRDRWNTHSPRGSLIVTSAAF